MSEAEESGQERLKRNFNELLQELRVAQAGVQILFGFLLSIVFTDHYQSVDQYVRVTHLVTILFAAAAVALLTGLACLAAAMTGTVLLLGEVIVGGWIAVVFGVVAGVGFAALWFVVPWLERYRDTIDSDGHPDSSVTV